MGKASNLIRLLLIVSGAIFFAVQFRMFFSHMQCSERARELAIENEKLFQKLHALRFNLTSLYAEKNFIRSELVSSKDNFRTIQKSYENRVKSMEELLKLKEENVNALNQKLQQLDTQLRKQIQIQNQIQKEIQVQRQLQNQNQIQNQNQNAVQIKNQNAVQIKNQNAVQNQKQVAQKSTVDKSVQKTNANGDASSSSTTVTNTTAISTSSIKTNANVDANTVAKQSSQSPQEKEKEKRIHQQMKDMENYKKFISVIYSPQSVVSAVVIMACNREDYLQRTIASVLKHHNSPSKFPLFISQDGTNENVKRVAKSFPQFIYMQHIETSPPVLNNPNENIAYYRIANHYKWALSQLFDIQGFARVIILEDDMEIAVDFFDYFESSSFLLDVDESLLAVSSWNDNGQSQFVKDPEALYRSDFFPGLGWMLKKQIWNELKPKWPKAYWDDWLRLQGNRKGRNTIYPEVCRTYNFGEHGSSYGQFFNTFLAPIKLNDVKVSWLKKDLNFLLEPFYSQKLRDEIDSAKLLNEKNSPNFDDLNSNSVFVYENQGHFERLAQLFGVFKEWKDGIPRTGFKGVVFFRYKGPHKIFLIHKSSASLLNLKRLLNTI